VSKLTEKIKKRSSENFNSHPLYGAINIFAEIRGGYDFGSVRFFVSLLEVKSKRNMTERSLGCAPFNLPLTVAYHTIVSRQFRGKNIYFAYISKHNYT
jgi:hypothetical protein